MSDDVKKKLVIVDYGMGNLTSVYNAIHFLGGDVMVSQSPDDVEKAGAIIIPGVGAFGQAMENLRKLKLVEPLTRQVMERKVPFLGICLGMQLVADDSEENGYHEGLKWIQGSVRRIAVKKGTRLPHIGWNDITVIKREPLFSDIRNDFNFYFVHSYHVVCDERYISATCQYGPTVTAAIQKDNIFATQFHPEKSQENGLRVLQSFMTFVDTYEGLSTANKVGRC